MPPKNVPYIEISLDNLIHNLNQVRERLGQSRKIIAVVKDNAYGCGAVVIAQTLAKEGVDFFAVGRMDEAQELRNNGIHSPILVLGECSSDERAWASSHDVRITVNDIVALTAIAQQDTRTTLHINIDTGMNRMGISPSGTAEAASIIAQHDHLRLEGVFTHFACADEQETGSVALQQQAFTDALAAITAQGLSPECLHYSNSAAVIRFPVPPDYHVRPGIMLYGSKPDPAQEFGIDLRPVASLRAGIVKIKKVPAGNAISYGWTYTPQEDTNIATVPIGYAHGYPRLLSNKADVLIRGRRFPVVGRVTMDYIMVNLGPQTDIRVGEEVVAMGSQGSETISPDDLALLCDTIGYEILCGLCNRIDRYYCQNSAVIEHQHFILQ